MFKVNELLKATQGKLINGSPHIVVRGVSIDSRTIKKDDAFIAIKGNNFDGHDFIEEVLRKGACCIIKKAQGRSADARNALQDAGRVAFIEVADTQKALGDIANFQRQKFDIPVIAITGSNGKTTAKEMIAWVLAKSFKVLKNEGTKNNQIGLPLTLLNLSHHYDIAVLELGTNHFGEIGYLSKICQPNIGIITNIGPAHLEYLNDLKGVFKEKCSLTTHLKDPYIAILNADDSLLRRQSHSGKKRPFIVGFGIKNNCDFFASEIKQHYQKLEFTINTKYKFNLMTPGYHNIYNVLAAVAVARLLGMEYKDISTRISTFEFPDGRLKFKKFNHLKILDDTYNSNPSSLKQALDALDNFKIKGRKIFIMGDMLELGSRKKEFHFQAGRYAAGVCDTIITVGGLSKSAAEAAKSHGFDSKNLFTCDSCNEARDILFNKIFPKEDDIVLVKGSRMMRMEEVFR